MVLLDVDPFLVQLNRMFDKSRDRSSIYVTMKRSDLQPPSKKNKEGAEYVCLVRATDRKKTISCKLTARSYEKFADSYNTILKGYTDALKKKEKKK